MSCKTDPNDERKFKVKLQKIQNDWTKEWSASTKKDTQEYKYNDKVLIRMGNSGKRSHPKRRFVEEGIILKKGKHSDNYKVLLIPPGQTNFTEQWVSIEDITSAKHTNKTNSCRKSHRSKYLILLAGEH